MAQQPSTNRAITSTMKQLCGHEPTIKQVLAMILEIIPTECGAARSTTYTPKDWQWQYRCASHGPLLLLCI